MIQTSQTQSKSRLFEWFTHLGHHRTRQQRHGSKDTVVSSSSSDSSITIKPTSSTEQQVTESPPLSPGGVIDSHATHDDCALDKERRRHSSYLNKVYHHTAPEEIAMTADPHYTNKRRTTKHRSLTNPYIYQPCDPYGLTPAETAQTDPEPLPCSDEDAYRPLPIRHELVRLALDGLFKSPVSGATKEKHVLQIGCGDGSWCVDMALMYPEWSVLGIDDTGPAPIQGKRTPRNFSYVRYASLLKGLKTLSDQQFDFVYGRFLGFYNKPAYYEKLIKECWRVCKPGGYVEMVELDMHIYGNPALGPMTHSLNGKVVRKMKSRSIDPQVATHLQDFFFNELLGQPRIRGDGYSTHYISLPLGVWGGRLGVMFRDDLHDIIEYWEEEDDAIRTNQELDSALDTLDVELEREKAFMNLHYVYAQKL